LRVLFIVEHYYPYIGGAEELWKSLAESLVNNGYEVKVITTLFKSKLPAKEVIGGVEVIRLKVGNRFGFTFLSIPSCVKWAKWADIIHTSSYNAALPARFAAWISRTKSIITFHEVWGPLWFNLPFLSFPERIAFSLFEKYILRMKFDCFVGVSQFTVDCLKEGGVPAKNVSLVYNGLDYGEFENLPVQKEKKFTFCFFGRPGLSKGLEVLIPAFTELCKENRDVHLKLIISKKPDKVFKWTRRTVETSGISNRVTFLHELPRKELLKEVVSSSAVVIPSHSEGFCFVAAESVAMGVPIISSGKGALKEVVGGSLIELETLDEESLFYAMTKACKGEWDYLPQRNFPLNEATHRYQEIYKNLLEKEEPTKS